MHLYEAKLEAWTAAERDRERGKLAAPDREREKLRTERELQLERKRLRSQQALSRTREEVRLRYQQSKAAEDAAAAAEKPDWSLALRFRLTAELRAELEQMEASWRSDRLRHMDEVATLERALADVRFDKEEAVTRLRREQLDLQRTYAVDSAQGKAIWGILKPELRHAEKLHEAHVEVLRRELEEERAVRERQTMALHSDLDRHKAALAQALDDLADERARREGQHKTSSAEIERLQSDIRRVSKELNESREAHRNDVSVLRTEARTVGVELETTRRQLVEENHALSASKELCVDTLTAEVARLSEARSQQAAEAEARLAEAECRRRAETASLAARVTHLRQAQQEALEHIPKGKGRQLLYLEP